MLIFSDNVTLMKQTSKQLTSTSATLPHRFYCCYNKRGQQGISRTVYTLPRPLLSTTQQLTSTSVKNITATNIITLQNHIAILQ